MSNSKVLNVYDSVNRNRLLGTHPRWAEREYDCKRYATALPMHMWDFSMSPGSVNSISVEHVTLQRSVITSPDGWDAEVALVTYDPLVLLMRLRDFRLPGEDAYHHAKRAGY